MNAQDNIFTGSRDTRECARNMEVVAVWESMRNPTYAEDLRSIIIRVTSYECHIVSNHQKLNCMFSGLLRVATKKISKLRITGPMCGESTGDWWHRSLPLSKSPVPPGAIKFVMTSRKHFPCYWAFAGNPLVTGEFPSYRPVTRSFDDFFDLCLNKRLSKNRHNAEFRRYRAHCDVIVVWYHDSSVFGEPTEQETDTHTASI